MQAAQALCQMLEAEELLFKAACTSGDMHCKDDDDDDGHDDDDEEEEEEDDDDGESGFRVLGLRLRVRLHTEW